MTFNKQIQTSVVEYTKTVVLTALVVGILAFLGGINYQKNAEVKVENKVVVNSSVEADPVPEVKK